MAGLGRLIEPKGVCRLRREQRFQPNVLFPWPAGDTTLVALKMCKVGGTALSFIYSATSAAIVEMTALAVGGRFF